MKEIVIIGARGFAKEFIGYLENIGDYRIVCILDELNETELFGYEIVHPDRFSGSCRNALLAIGYPYDKKDVCALYSRFDFKWETFIHPMSNVSPYAHIGKGVMIAPFAVVAGNAKIDSFVFINSFASVGHDTVVGSYSSLMPYACLAGRVSVEETCLLAIGAKVLPGITVHSRSRVSAGVIVTRDIPQDSLVFGNPMQIQPDITMIKKTERKD